MIKEYMPYYEYLKFEEWKWMPRSACWKQYLRLQRYMRRLIALSLLSLTVNVILVGMVFL